MLQPFSVKILSLDTLVAHTDKVPHWGKVALFPSHCSMLSSTEPLHTPISVKMM